MSSNYSGYPTAWERTEAHPPGRAEAGAVGVLLGGFCWGVPLAERGRWEHDSQPLLGTRAWCRVPCC